MMLYPITINTTYYYLLVYGVANNTTTKRGGEMISRDVIEQETIELLLQLTCEGAAKESAIARRNWKRYVKMNGIAHLGV